MSGPDEPSAASGGGDFTDDTLLGGRVRLRQPSQGYRAAIDPVLLAAAVPALDGERAFEVGCGAGAAMLCLAARIAGVRVAAVERDRRLVRLAQANIVANGFAQRIDVMAGDLVAPPLRLVPSGFDHVFLNPPYREAAHGTPPPDPGRRAANVADGASLADWFRFALLMARPGGTVSAIFRADGLASLLAAALPGVGGLSVFPIWPGPADGLGPGAKPAKRVIVRGRKGSRAPMALLPGLVLHGPGGGYTAAAEAVLRDGAALALGAP